jgi:release factor glutamine methyltransferase
LSTVSWRELLSETAARLDETDARRLIEEASGYEGADLYPALENPSTVRGVAALDQMIERRLGGEPLQYVLGHWSFRTLDLAVDSRVLIPRPETEQLAGAALDELAKLEHSGRPPVAVDLGTGSGAIGLSIAVENVAATVICTDVSEPALAVARANMAGVGRPATRVRLCSGSWFEALPADLLGRIDLIVSNPPYVGASDDLPNEVRNFEPMGALVAGPTGLEAAQEIIAGARTWIRPGGSLLLELAPDQLTAASELARAHGFAEIEIRRDLAGRDRILIAK